MKLGFDLDEVVVSLSPVFERHLKEEYNIDWPINCFRDYGFEDCAFTEDKEKNDAIVKDMLFVANNPDYQFTGEPIEDAIETLFKLKHQGHELHFITNRPKANKHKTFLWLRKYKIPFTTLHVLGSDAEKGATGARLKLDMFVDDLQKHLEGMLEYKTKWRKGLLLFDRPWNQGSIDGSKYKRVHNWNEILRHVGVANR